MAYVEGNISVRIEGVIAGSEQWVNTWAFHGATTDTEQDACVDALHAFYSGLADDWFSESWSAVNATVIDHFNGTSRSADFTLIEGGNVNDPLPSNVAVRVSLATPFNQNGGPFICGWAATLTGPTGLFDATPRTALVTAVSTLASDVDTAGAVLGLHLPTSELVVTVTRAKVGQVYDVIRRRRNELSENYQFATLP